MITLDDTTDPTTVVARASGRVTADDYESVLLPAVEAAAGSGPVRLLYVLGDDFDGYDVEAGVDDLRMGLHHWRDFARIALVTDHEGLRVMARALGFAMPGEVRVHALDDVEAAMAWVTGD